MGGVCTKSDASPPPRPATDSVVPITEKASESVQKAVSAAAEEAQEAQQQSAEAAQKAVEEIKAIESEAKKELSSAQEQARQELESPTENVMPISEADHQLLAAAKQQVAAKQNVPSNSPLAYLFYASDLQGGSLIQQFVPQAMTAEEMKEKKLILLATFIPAAHKTVPKTKLQQNGGVTSFLQEIKYKWEIWGKAQRQAYYQGWVKFLKAADDMEATVRLHHFSSPAQPAKVFVLHTPPTENKVLPIKEEEDLKISLFGFAAVVPSSSVYKPGSNITQKRFGDMATEAGGAYMQLSRRGGDAAFDQAEMIKWLAEEGLKPQEAGKGIAMDAAGTYERRSEQKGGNVPVTQA